MVLALPPHDPKYQKTTVVNIRRTAKWDVYIGRAGHGLDGYFGNPYAVEPHGREVCISMFKSYFERRIQMDPEFKAAVLSLRGKVLSCFCAPQLCHGTVIADWVDAQPLTQEPT